MAALFIVSLCVLAVTKVTLQGAFAKKNVVNDLDGTLFNGTIFLVVALIFSYKLFSLDAHLMLYGTVFGVVTVFFQLFYIRSFAYGDISISVMTVNLAMIAPIIFSLIAYGEKLTVVRGIGIALSIFAIVIGTEKITRSVDPSQTENEKIRRRKRLIFSIAASVINGFTMIFLKIFAKSEYGGKTQEFLFFGYVFAALLSGVLFLVIRARGKKLSFRPGKKMLLYAILAGVFLGLHQFVYMAALKKVDATVMYPCMNGGIMILSGLSGLFLLKDKLAKRQIAALCIAAAAIVMMSL